MPDADLAAALRQQMWQPLPGTFAPTPPAMRSLEMNHKTIPQIKIIDKYSSLLHS
jgi:hypothetical protein